MGETYIKYGAIAVGVLLVLYFLSRRSAPAASDGGALAVDVQYSPTSDPAASIGARAQAFGELVGLGGTMATIESQERQASEANVTARQISSDELALGRYGLDVGLQAESLRGQRAMETAQYQAGQVRSLAESFRNKGVDRMSAALSALTSTWGAEPVFAPQRRSGAADIINAISSGVSKFFSFGLG